MASKFGYNGKELNSELELDWYDFGARNYDASLGRWMNIDPLAENYSATSPYVYTLNNPLFFVDPDGRKIRNADEVRKQTAQKELKTNQAVVASAESLYGTKKGDFKSKSDYKRYKQAKRDVRKSKRKVKKYTKRAEATQAKIDEFESNSQEMFATMDNIQNEYGEEVDIMMTTESISNANGQNVYQFLKDPDNTEFRVFTKEFDINTIVIQIDPNIKKSYRGNLPTTLEVVKHEMGHANYIIKNLQEYQQYYQKNKKNFKSGHRKDDKSGQRAEEWETKNDL